MFTHGRQVAVLVSFARIPNIQRGELARQSLWVRIVLIPLFGLISLQVADSYIPVAIALTLYCLSSGIIAAVYRG